MKSSRLAVPMSGSLSTSTAMIATGTQSGNEAAHERRDPIAAYREHRR